MTEATATPSPFLATAALGAGGNQLVVSIHDVAPSTRAVAQEIISELKGVGVDVCSLLVVPDYHHRRSAWDDRAFVDWLREMEEAGHEIVIHGYFHARPRKEGESLRARLLTRFYTRGEGEFYDLEYAEALRRIVLARDRFVNAGLKPRGFIAPAWLLGTEAARAAADAEMEYTTRLTTVEDLRSEEVFPSRSLVYSVENGWRRAASLLWNGALARLLAAQPLLRLGIHPPDFAHRRIREQIIHLAERAAEGRTPTTYRDWIAERRMARAGDA